MMRRDSTRDVRRKRFGRVACAAADRVLHGTSHSLQRKRNDLGQQDALRLAQYERWRPKVRIVIAELRDLLARHRIPEPDGIDEAVQFPPKDEKVKSDE